MSLSQSASNGLALDARALDGLRRDAGRDPKAAIQKAAGQFEALFMQQLLKSMRDAMPKSGMFQGPGHDTYVGMLDQQLAQSVSGRSGGLAEMLAKQLSQHVGKATTGPQGPALGGEASAAGAAAQLAAAAATTAAGSSTPAKAVAAGGAGGANGALAFGGLARMPNTPAMGNAAGATMTDPRSADALAAARGNRLANLQALAGRPLMAASFRPWQGTGIGPGGSRVAGAGRADQPQLSLDPQAAAALKESLAKRLDGPQAGFVESMWPHAVAAQRQTGVPAAFVVGQAALESGWGKRQIKHADGSSAHNLFGIKATGGWTGRTVDVMTTEYVEGKAIKTVERFRAYGSYAEAFKDWAGLMQRQSRYADVLRGGHTVDGFAQGMQRAGYATDPRYGAKLERTINQTLLLQRLTT